MNFLDIILWCDIKVTLIVCSTILGLLVCLTKYSVASVFANSAMLLMMPMLVLKLLVTAKSACTNGEAEHPLKSVLPKCVDFPKDKAQEYGEKVTEWIQRSVAHIGRLLFVEDLAYSLTVFAALYLLSHLSQWFSGISLLFIGFIGLFTLPKIYDMYKVEIQTCNSKIHDAISEITSTITAKFPSYKSGRNTKDVPAGDEAGKNKNKEKKS